MHRKHLFSIYLGTLFFSCLEGRKLQFPGTYFPKRDRFFPWICIIYERKMHPCMQFNEGPDEGSAFFTELRLHAHLLDGIQIRFMFNKKDKSCFFLLHTGRTKSSGFLNWDQLAGWLAETQALLSLRWSCLRIVKLSGSSSEACFLWSRLRQHQQEQQPPAVSSSD